MVTNGGGGKFGKEKEKKRELDMVKKEALGSEEDMERHRLNIAMEKKNMK